MTTAGLTTVTVGGSLRGRRLKAPVITAVVVGVLALVALLFAVTPMKGRAEYGVVSWLAVLVGLLAVSWVVEGRRRAADRVVTFLVLSSFVAAIAPLVSVLTLTISHGMHRFDYTFFTHSMRNVADSDVGGGAYAAIVGTLEQVGLTMLICIPVGLLVAVYLSEYGGTRLARAVGGAVDVMTGLPSIVAGLFVVALWLLLVGHGPKSGFAGALALSVLMLPVIVRSSEEMLKLVPDALREAGLALGVPYWKTILRIVLPTALPGITTGIMLAVARVTGETAPLLLTVFGNPSINNNAFSGPQEALPLFVFNQALLPNPTAINRAWTGALTLILIVLVLNLLARVITALGVGRNLRGKA